MAIAWRCRDQYGDANLKMLTVTDPSGLVAGWFSVLSAAIVMPVSCVMAASMGAHPILTGAVAALGIWQLVWAARFCSSRNDEIARNLLRASLVYLPVVLLVVVIVSFV